MEPTYFVAPFSIMRFKFANIKKKIEDLLQSRVYVTPNTANNILFYSLCRIMTSSTCRLYDYK